MSLETLLAWAHIAGHTLAWMYVVLTVAATATVAGFGVWAGLEPRFVVSMTLRAPVVVAGLVVSRLLAPVAVLCQRDPTRLPAWAALIGPADHDIAGLPTGHPDLPADRKGADPMAVYWWELKGPYKTRPKWVDWVRERFGIHDTRHWFVRLWQLMRNGGAGAMYRLLGMRADTLLITRQEAPGRTEYLAYRWRDTTGVGGGRHPLPSAKPVAQYLSVVLRLLGHKIELQIGPGKLNYSVPFGDRSYCKWVCTARVRS